MMLKSTPASDKPNTSLTEKLSVSSAIGGVQLRRRENQGHYRRRSCQRNHPEEPVPARHSVQVPRAEETKVEQQRDQADERAAYKVVPHHGGPGTDAVQHYTGERTTDDNRGAVGRHQETDVERRCPEMVGEPDKSQPCNAITDGGKGQTAPQARETPVAQNVERPHGCFALCAAPPVPHRDPG